MTLHLLVLLIFRPKKVETSAGNHRSVKKQTSADTVTANGSSSSESEEESSDESEEESESNSSDEEENPAINKHAKPKGFVPDMKDVTSAVVDMDVDKQVWSWTCCCVSSELVEFCYETRRGSVISPSESETEVCVNS